VRNFIVLFNEKEGTTPVMQLLDGFDAVSVVHQADGGWEPFDAHNCGRMRLGDLERCLRFLYAPGPVDIDAVNRLYLATGTKPLAPVEAGAAVGFKMRFRPPRRSRFGRLRRLQQRRFEARLTSVLRELDVTVFMAVRQDILRWALSKYHGDGSGSPGHLQFALAEGTISRADIGRIHVDLPELGRILDACRRDHARKRSIVDELSRQGVRTAVLRYEDFVADPHAFFAAALGAIDVEPGPGEIEAVLARGTKFEKVHADDLREFVENPDEVLATYGDAFVAW
jgi:hypothetical protein